MGLLDAVRSLDAYRKLPRDLSESTLCGALLTALAALAVAFLVGGEARAYLTADTTTTVVVDKSLNGDVLPINFQIEFPQLSCAFATLDISNAMGSHSLNVDGMSTLGAKSIRKVRLDAQGQRLGPYVDRAGPVFKASDPAFLKLESEAIETVNDPDAAEYLYEDEDVLDALQVYHSDEVSPDNFHEIVNSAELVMVAFMAEWCAWCKMLKPIWHHTAGELSKQYSPEQVVLANVDCVAHEKFCSAENVQGFPTIRVYRKGSGGKAETYAGDRTTEGVTKFVQGILSAPDAQTSDADRARAARNERIALSQVVKHEEEEVGCLIDGHVLVKKVPGALLFGAHAVGHSFSNVHLNLSHVINHLSFGHVLTDADLKDVHAVLRGPEGEPWHKWSARFLETPFTAATDNVTFEHYVNVVLQTVERGEYSIDVYDTTAHSTQFQSDSQASVRVAFVPSPFQVVVEAKYQPLAQFLTNLMAIVGGVFTIASLLDRVVWNTQQLVKKNIGKLG
jgi:protein disulfide-isomerase-like protein